MTLIVKPNIVDFGASGEPTLGPDYWAIALGIVREREAIRRMENDLAGPYASSRPRKGAGDPPKNVGQDLRLQNAGQPESHGSHPPTTGQAPLVITIAGDERPREVAADQSTGDDPVDQQYIWAGQPATKGKRKRT